MPSGPVIRTTTTTACGPLSPTTQPAELQLTLTFNGLRYHGLQLYFPGKENISKIEMPANSSRSLKLVAADMSNTPSVCDHTRAMTRLGETAIGTLTTQACRMAVPYLSRRRRHQSQQRYDSFFITKRSTAELTKCLVDGYNIPIALEFGQNSTCKPLYCQVYSEDLEELCPAENLWKITGTVGSMSDCRRTDSREHCWPLRMDLTRAFLPTCTSSPFASGPTLMRTMISCIRAAI